MTQGRRMSRRDFLKVGGTRLAGAAFLGAAGCGGGEQSGSATEIYFTSAPDESGTTEKLIRMFNDRHKGEYRVIFGDQPFYISSTSKNPDAAWKFIQFLTAPEQQQLRAVEGAYLPTRTALYDDPEIQEKVPVVALQHTRPRPVSPYYSADISLEMREQFNASLSGDISPEEAAQTLKEQLERFIKQGQQT